MKKTIELSLETARKLYKTGTVDIRALILENFTEAELEEKITDTITKVHDVCYHIPYPWDTTDKNEAQINALVKLKAVIKALNEGWEPDWDNKSEYKYVVYFSHDDGVSVDYDSWYARHDVPAGLYLKNVELCKHLIKHFRPLLEEAYL